MSSVEVGNRDPEGLIVNIVRYAEIASRDADAAIDAD
jgi:hypothetical protein